MKKTMILAGLVLAGSLAFTRGAVAQTNTYTFDLNPTGGGATGTWKVTIQKYSSAAADLPGKQFRIDQIVTGTAPNANGISVSLSLFGKMDGTGPYLSFGPILGKSGLSTGPAHSPVTSTDKEWLSGASNLNSPGIKKTQWTTQVPTDAVAHQLKKTGTNFFTQTAAARAQTLKPAGAASGYVTVYGVGGQTWGGLVVMSTVNAPEASSLALLLPGLIPLGIVMRKRSRSRAASTN